MKKKNKEKERQNKNKISSLILTLVIISFLFLVFFVLISSLIIFLPKEGLINFNEEIKNVFRISKNKFIIYEEECVNETILIDYTYTEFCLYGLDKDIIPICPRMNDKIVFLEPITLGVSEQLRLGKKAITKERCEKVEVEEIEYIPYQYLECSKWSNFSYNENGEYSRKCIATYMKDELINISKKDLTKEWLDENCGCFNYASYMGFFGKISNPTIDPKVFNEIKEDCIKHDDYNGADFCKAINNGKIRCSKYKCFENYYVEIN